MKKYFKSNFVKFFAFLILSILTFSIKANAEIASTNTLQDFQSQINSAMLTRQTSYTINYTGNSTTLKTDIANVIDNIYNADDYLHYTSKGYSYSVSSASGVSTINFTFTYWNTAAYDSYINSKVTQILSEIITSDMNDFQKEKKIHDWIVQNVAYDTTLIKHSDYDALISPYKTVCQGYALLAYKMLNQSGIETKILEGTASGQAHSWNLVKLDGNWYHLDPTWDDPTPDVVGRITYGYYNLTDSQIKANHSWVKTYPTANTDFSTTLNTKLISDSSNVSVYQGLIDLLELNFQTDQYTVDDAIELNSKIQEAIKNNQNNIRIRYLKGSTLVTDIKTAIAGISNISSYSYSKNDYIRTSLLGDVLLDLTFNYSVPTSVGSVSLSSNSLALSTGATSTLTATILPSNSSNKTIIWSTSNPSVATVANGVVKALGGGTAIITAKTADGGYLATCNIQVVQGVTSITITSASPYVKLGGQDITLAATVNPSGATDKSLIWKSSNTNIATVDSNGKVHAVAYGTVVISATSVQDPTKVAKCTVIVPVSVSTVSISSTSTFVKMGGTLPLSAVIAPTNATIKTVTWSSSDTSIAKVSATGVVTPVSLGSVTITATTIDGNIVATKTLKVIYAITSVTLDKTSAYLKIGDTDLLLTATINPTNVTDKSLIWKSSNTNIATVDSNGKVHVVTYGTVVISATSVQDPTKVAKCTVIVPVPVSTVSISSTSTFVKMGGTLPLRAVIAPTNATIKTVTWSSSDTSIAKVSATGVVTPVSLGSVTITATTIDGNIVATKTLKVIYAITSVTLDKTSTYLKVGATDLSLAATINPTNAADKSLIWKSSNTNIATVDSNGKVHAVAYGTVVISATSVQDPTKIAKCTVIVPVPVSTVSISSTSTFVKMGGTLPLSAVITPTNATIKTVTWTSSDTSIAKVSATGVVTPVSLGSVTITATTIDGNIVATKTLKVIYAITSLTLDKASASLKVGDTDLSLTATINPTNVTDKSLIWKSSNTNIATVDSNGKVHAVSSGTVVISATSVQDPTKVAKCTVTTTK